MGFYERYEKLCIERGLDPCAQKTADMFGVTRATISVWKKNDKVPMGETIAAIADALGVSTDYLLGRTDDPIDYTNADLIAEVRDEVLDHFDGDVRKAIAYQYAEKKDVETEYETLYTMISDLDPAFQERIKGYMTALMELQKNAKEED